MHGRSLWTKTGGTGFLKPVVPVSAHGQAKTGGTDFGGDAQLGAQRPEQKKEGLGEVEGNAVMLTYRENDLSCHISI